MLANYIIGTTAFGLVRKGVEMRRATVTRRHPTTKQWVQRPVLVADKLLITAMCTSMSMYIWPYWVYIDLKKAELLLRPDLVEPCEQNKQHAIEYVWS